MMRGAGDRLEGVSEPGVIYALDCKDCPRVYIGETARTAKQRTREHKCHTNCSKRESFQQWRRMLLMKATKFIGNLKSSPVKDIH